MKKYFALLAVLLCAGVLNAAEKPSIGVADFKNDTSAVHLEGAARGLGDPREELERRGFPRAVLAEDAVSATAGDVEGNVVEGGSRAANIDLLA